MAAQLLFLLKPYDGRMFAEEVTSWPEREDPDVVRLTIDLPSLRLIQACDLLRSIANLEDIGRYVGYPLRQIVLAPWDRCHEGLRIDIVPTGDGQVQALFGKRRHKANETDPVDSFRIDITDEWWFLRRNPITQGHINQLILHLTLASWREYKKRNPA